MSNLLRFHEITEIVLDFGNMPKTKSVLGRIVLLKFYSKWAKSKNVKRRILRIQSVVSFGNPNLLIVEFFRLASIKAVFFFPIGIC